MIRRFIAKQLSYANIVATLALVLVLTGGAYAATQLPKNSVTSKQVKDHSLREQDFKEGDLPAGPGGPAGPTGQPGASGVLASGAKRFVDVDTPSCSTYLKTGGSFTVASPAVLTGIAQLKWQQEQNNTPEQVQMRIKLLDQTNQVVGRSLGVENPIGGKGQVADAGVLFNDATGLPLVLQPGTIYTVQLEAILFSNVCSEVLTTASQLSWVAHPAP